MNVKELLDLAEKHQFEHYGPMAVEKLQLQTEVRDMCAADKCRAYGKSWSCPPACGSLDEIREKLKPYTTGVLLQSTAQMEDSFDVETMMDLEKIHKQRFYALVDQLRAGEIDFFPMSAGTCTCCENGCAWPEPCRIPGRGIPSMEACGIFVSKICADSGLPYYYGKDTITYTSCILLP